MPTIKAASHSHATLHLTLVQNILTLGTIRERIKNDEINLTYCSTKDMVADIFTKPLLLELIEKFEKFRAVLGVGEY